MCDTTPPVEAPVAVTHVDASDSPASDVALKATYRPVVLVCDKVRWGDIKIRYDVVTVTGGFLKSAERVNLTTAVYLVGEGKKPCVFHGQQKRKLALSACLQSTTAWSWDGQRYSIGVDQG